ncbi:hypothetical protein P43SY_006799 [Pythium insidiosum]|uniref:Uncharacterized protein n=1 Tax=Pythium insidiosum TaxID=114742 RepID=A0AAD5QBC3_PYTIN|nr:hypothetical protein P43SY_006799 [Pythium insidiosum]
MRFPFARVVSLVVAVALLLSAVSGFFALFTARWRVASLPGTQQVANHTFTEQIIVGEYRTCVTLRRETPATNDSDVVQVRREENCYNTFPVNLFWSSRLRDVSTGEKAYFIGVCWINRDRVARVLGIPEDVPMQSLWKRQCFGVRSASVGTQAVAAAMAVIGGAVLIFDRNDKERPYRGMILIAGLTAALSLVPLVIWFGVVKKPGFDVGPSLRLAGFTWGIHLASFLALTLLHFCHSRSEMARYSGPPIDREVVTTQTADRLTPTQARAGQAAEGFARLESQA